MANYTRLAQKLTGMQLTAQTPIAEITKFINGNAKFQITMSGDPSITTVQVQTLAGGWDTATNGDYIINGGLAGCWVETPKSFAAFYGKA